MELEVMLINNTKNVVKVPEILIRSKQLLMENPSPIAHKNSHSWIETLPNGRLGLFTWSAFENLEIWPGLSKVVVVDEHHIYARFKRLIWATDSEGNQKLDFVARGKLEWSKIDPLRGQFPVTVFRNFGGMGQKSASVVDPTLSFLDKPISVPAGLLIERKLNVFSPYSSFSEIDFKYGSIVKRVKRLKKELEKLWRMRDEENIKLVQAGYPAILPPDEYQFNPQISVKEKEK